MPNFISEDQIEQALLQKLQHVHGYDVLECGTAEREDPDDGSNRASKREVLLLDRLREAAVALNPGVPAAQIDAALERITDRRAAMSPVQANREVYELIRDGVPVEFDDDRGRKQQARVRLIDFENPENPANQFLAVSQLWVQGEAGFRRPDVLLYVNGLPLVFIELKNSNVRLRNAYDDRSGSRTRSRSSAWPRRCRTCSTPSCQRATTGRSSRRCVTRCSVSCSNMPFTAGSGRHRKLLPTRRSLCQSKPAGSPQKCSRNRCPS